MNLTPDEHANINVIVRVRGRSKQEIKTGSSVIVKIPDFSTPPPSSFIPSRPSNQENKDFKNSSTHVPTEICINTTNETGIVADISSKTFTIDKAYGPETDQQQFFQGTAAPLFDEFLKGYNCTMFAYGQTGAGKTYTMYGDEKHLYFNINPNAGIIPRIIYSLFDRLGSVDGSKKQTTKGSNSPYMNSKSDFIIKCSFLELYNEELKDLFAVDDSKKLRIFEQQTKSPTDNMGSSSFHASSRCNIVTQNLEEITLKNADHAMKILEQGLKKRQVAATKLNDVSSRSHTIFTIYLYRSTNYKKSVDDNDDIKSVTSISSISSSGEFRISKFNLVDLAGSENIGRSGAINQRAREAGSINQSLLTLGRVINGLVDGESHIPYRESKLTRLLQDSLGGQTKTVLIANVSPARMNMEETLSTLQYASKAKNIRNQPQIGTLIMKNMLVKDLATEIARLKADLNATRLKNGIFIDKDNYTELHKSIENLNTENLEYKTRTELLQRQIIDFQNELKVKNDFISEKGEEIFNCKKITDDLQKNLLEKNIINNNLLNESKILKKNVQALNGNINELIENKNNLTNQLKRILNNDIRNNNLQLQMTINNLLEVSKAPQLFTDHLQQLRSVVNYEFSNYNNKILLVSEKIDNLLISQLPNSFKKIVNDLKVLEGISNNMENNIRDNYSNILGFVFPQSLEENDQHKNKENCTAVIRKADLITAKLHKEFQDTIESEMVSKEYELIENVTKIIKENSKKQRSELFSKFSTKNNEILKENFSNLEIEKKLINKQVKDNFRKIHNELMNDIISSKTNFQNLLKYLDKPIEKITSTSEDIKKMVNNFSVPNTATASSTANNNISSIDDIINNLKVDVLKDYAKVDRENDRLSTISRNFQKTLLELPVNRSSYPRLPENNISHFCQPNQESLNNKENIEVCINDKLNQSKILTEAVINEKEHSLVLLNKASHFKQDTSSRGFTRSLKKRAFKETQQSSIDAELMNANTSMKNNHQKIKLGLKESENKKEVIEDHGNTGGISINKMRKIEENLHQQPSKLPIFKKKYYDFSN